MSKKFKCPKCNSEDVMEIIYGLPSPEVWEKSERD